VGTLPQVVVLHTAQSGVRRGGSCGQHVGDDSLRDALQAELRWKIVQEPEGVEFVKTEGAAMTPLSLASNQCISYHRIAKGLAIRSQSE
jgi:hypothetical protein